MAYFLTIFFGTFVLEDMALAFALGLVASERLGLAPAFLACFLGISLGDLGLYVLGRFAGRIGFVRRWGPIKKIRAAVLQNRVPDFLTYSVIVSRFIPGTRLTTYLMAGFLRYPVFKFTALTGITVLAWVTLAFAANHSLKSVLFHHWILSVIAIVLLLRLFKYFVPRLVDPWDRKALRHSWRQFLSFEFWPGTLFYLPIVPYYVFLSLRHRSFLVPFYANPEIENAGLIGESKWDFLKHLTASSSYTLRSVKIERPRDADAIRTLLGREGFDFPFILKPDVGQRGFGVRILRSERDLADYISSADFDVIAQRLSLLPKEAGIFYVRRPEAAAGFIFSVTDKIFPHVTGDGSASLGDLILADRRARKIAAIYFARHRASLSHVLRRGEVFALTECGNHCQGAIFVNGQDLITDALTQAIEGVARQIPGFYFGRFDVRYQDCATLRQGQNFEIVEVNGAGSEATHIWDAHTRLSDAYRTLFAQWKLLFEVGAQIKKSAPQASRVRLRKLAGESLRVYFRQEPLSVSS